MSKLKDRFLEQAKFAHESVSAFFKERRYATRTSFHQFFILNREKHQLDETFELRASEFVYDEETNSVIEYADRIALNNRVSITSQCVIVCDLHFNRSHFEELSDEREIIALAERMYAERAARNYALFCEYLAERVEFDELMMRIAKIARRMHAIRRAKTDD